MAGIAQVRAMDPGTGNWIDYTSTAGEPVNASTEAAATCYAQCLGTNLMITGAKEGGHSPGSAHGTGEACDFSEKRNPGLLGNGNLGSCFNQCFGGGYGQIESTPPHVHVQTRPGRGGATGFAPGVQ